MTKHAMRMESSRGLHVGLLLGMSAMHTPYPFDVICQRIRMVCLHFWFMEATEIVGEFTVMIVYGVDLWRFKVSWLKKEHVVWFAWKITQLQILSFLEMAVYGGRSPPSHWPERSTRVVLMIPMEQLKGKPKLQRKSGQLCVRWVFLAIAGIRSRKACGHL